MSKLVSRLLVWVVAAAWLVSSICSARINNVLLMSPEMVTVPQKLTFYPIVPFDTAHATRTRYKNFIENVREEMISVDEVHGIPRLQNPAKLSVSNRFLQVALYSSSGAHVILAIDRANCSVVGYRTQFTTFFFPDIDEPPSSLFPGLQREYLPFKSRYSDMEQVGGRNRTTLGLGMGELDRFIELVDDTTIYTSELITNQALFLLVASQMVSDAIRYRYVEKAVMEQITEDKSNFFYPNATMIALEDNWIVLSIRIQESVGGVIDPGFVLPGVSNTITSINPIIGPQIALILYICDDCRKIEPTVNLIGRNGFCADVQDSVYEDGNPIILWPCKSSDDNANQLFTLMQDGTIRCQDKCLTAYSLKPNRYVMIHNCTTASESSGIKWQVEDNGNIINKEHSLALNAFVGFEWSVLTVDPISYSSRQAWKFTNSTDISEPAVASILSYNGLYLQASGNNSVQLVQGNDNNVPQWEIYSDGTVRPSGIKTSCLARGDLSSDAILHLCDGGNAERWLINHDGSISDATNGYVLEVNKDEEIVVVKRSADAPTTHQIFVVDIKF